MYMAGRRRTASRPSSTLMEVASYCLPPGLVGSISFSAICSPELFSLRCLARARDRRGLRIDAPSACARTINSKTFYGSKTGEPAECCGRLLRTSFPCAAPCDSVRVRTKLVGLLAPSHLAQRDVAKTHAPREKNPRR